MIVTIHKGKHRSWPPIIGLFFKKRMERIVSFDITAKYDLPGTEDDEDVNKLFGFGFFPSHHKESARFGWTWDNSTGKIVLWAYCYRDGERSITRICEIATYQRVKLSIDIIGNVYSFTVTDALNQYYVYGGIDILIEHKKIIGYKLGCFFGGNKPAPHDITIKISKK